LWRRHHPEEEPVLRRIGEFYINPLSTLMVLVLVNWAVEVGVEEECAKPKVEVVGM
jgi:hypothetical protein